MTDTSVWYRQQQHRGDKVQRTSNEQPGTQPADKSDQWKPSYTENKQMEITG